MRVSLPVPVVWSEDCLRHEPAGEVWLGQRDPGTEVPARALALRAALTAAGAPVTAARRHDDTILRRVHDPALLGHLASVWEDWEAAGLPAGYGRDRVVPTCSPPPACWPGCRRRSARGRARPGGAVLLRHDDAGRPGQLGRDPGRRQTPRRPPRTWSAGARQWLTRCAARPGIMPPAVRAAGPAAT